MPADARPGALPDVLPGVRKIAVLRANALGDFVFALPALAALRAAYPHAEMVLLGRAWHAAFLAGRPSPVDRVVPVPPAAFDDDPSRVEPREREALLARLRAEHFDLAIQMHGGGRNSNPFVLEVGAHTTAGTATADAAPLDRAVPYVYYQSEYARWLEVVALVGAAPVDLAPRLPVTDADLAEVERIVPERGPLAVLHPGATDPRRRWPAESFASVGRALVERGVCVVITGTPPESAITRRVAAGIGGRGGSDEVIDVTGRLSLGGLAGLLARASVVVSNDTGPLHLAAAVGAPAVGIYWIGNLVNGGELTRAGRRVAISWRTACPTCGTDNTRERCAHDDSFVADVPVEDVLRDAIELLTGNPDRG